jgi:hypothetical protein
MGARVSVRSSMVRHREAVGTRRRRTASISDQRNPSVPSSRSQSGFVQVKQNIEGIGRRPQQPGLGAVQLFVGWGERKNDVAPEITCRDHENEKCSGEGETRRCAGTNSGSELKERRKGVLADAGGGRGDTGRKIGRRLCRTCRRRLQPARDTRTTSSSSAPHNSAAVSIPLQQSHPPSPPPSRR